MKTIYPFLFILLFTNGILQAQKVINANLNENVTIHLNDCLGDIQWQKSTDNIKWFNIDDAHTKDLLFVVDTTTSLRAYVTYKNCIPYISDVATIIVGNPVNKNFNTDSAISVAYDNGKYPDGSMDLCMYKLCYSDLIKFGTNILDQEELHKYATFTSFDASNIAIKKLWNNYYDGISNSCKIINYINYLNINQLDTLKRAQRNLILGKAYFFRAYFYKCLIERWDNIVITDHTIAQSETGVKLATKEEVYNLIVSDLEASLSLLPQTLNTRTEVSIDVARQLLSLVYMDIEAWSKAAVLTDQIINCKAYSFLPVNQLASIFSVKTQENSEIIFSWKHDKKNQQFYSPMLIPRYNQVSGIATSWEGGGRCWARLHPSDYYWTLFEPKDPRLEAWHKRFWVFDTNTADDPLPQGVSIGDTATSANIGEAGGYGLSAITPTTKKNWEDNTLGRTLTDAQGYKNIIQYRLSQTYLIATEAYFKLGNSTKAQQYFDTLRTARGMSSIPVTMENILDEHARELGQEGHRYAMLKRLGILYERVHKNPDWEETFQQFNVRWPIPQSFIDYTGVQQNEGY